MSKTIRYLTMFFATAIVLVTIAGCGAASGSNQTVPGKSTGVLGTGKQFAMPETGEEVAVMETSMGTIYIRLFPEDAPKAVENFVTHAKNGYYNGLIFHRVIDDFMIQGGDPTGTGRGGESIWGKDFEDEFTLDLFNYRGALSMANAGANTNGSQFFIVQASSVPKEILSQLPGAGFPKEATDNYTKTGGTPALDHKHTVFGMVFQGMDVVDFIAGVKTDTDDKPEKDITINSLNIVKWESK